jgi:hypothetical protein
MDADCKCRARRQHLAWPDSHLLDHREVDLADQKDARDRAEGIFKTKEDQTAKAVAEQETEAIRERAARLTSLRLAKEAAKATGSKK